MKRAYVQCLALLLILFTTTTSAMAELTVKGGDDLSASAEKGNIQALQALQKAAQDGDVVGQTKLGDYYNFGVGRAARYQDYAKAYTRYRKAAARNYPEADFKLATLYANGHGVPADVHKAMKWYRKAYARDYYEAAYRMGRLYGSGGRIPQDYVEAAKWYLKGTTTQFMGWISFFWLAAIVVMAATIVFARFTNSDRFLELVTGFVRDMTHRRSIEFNEALVRVLAVIVFARTFSYCLYWTPLWFEGGIHDQAASWAPLCIDIWTASGLLGGLLTVAATNADRGMDRSGGG